jgi:hypothetical protein
MLIRHAILADNEGRAGPKGTPRRRIVRAHGSSGIASRAQRNPTKKVESWMSAKGDRRRTLFVHMQRSHPNPWLRRLRSVVPIIALAASGCDGDDDDHSHGHEHDSGHEDPCEGVEDFRIGAIAEGEVVRITVLEATPSQPFRGDNAWTVSLSDLADMPLEPLEIEVQPWMPDHGHGTAVGAEITDRGDGEIHVDPINLWMAGLWEVRFLVTVDEDTLDTAVLEVCVD